MGVLLTILVAGSSASASNLQPRFSRTGKAMSVLALLAIGGFLLEGPCFSIDTTVTAARTF